jgi:rare lipoprotein A
MCQLVLAFTTLPALAEQQQKESSDTVPVAATAAENDGSPGIASYYAKRYQGRKTFSGARYNPDKLTAAHASLPMGTRVRVANPANGKEVVVTINDRCRKLKGNHIDLSRAAAAKLEFLGRGAIPVRISPLSDQES